MSCEGGYCPGTTSCSSSKATSKLLPSDGELNTSLVSHFVVFTFFPSPFWALCQVNTQSMTCLHPRPRSFPKELRALLCEGPASAPADRRRFQARVCLRRRRAADAHHPGRRGPVLRLHAGRQPDPQRAGRRLHAAGQHGRYREHKGRVGGFRNLDIQHTMNQKPFTHNFFRVVAGSYFASYKERLFGSLMLE